MAILRLCLSKGKLAILHESFITHCNFICVINIPSLLSVVTKDLVTFLGMYIAFLISYVCFYIHADGMDSRFGLTVGSLFAVIGNKYIIDSALPESSSFTLVDLLHGVTLFFIFATIAANAYSLNLIKKDKPAKAYRFDMVASWIVLILYVGLNIFFIWEASNGF